MDLDSPEWDEDRLRSDLPESELLRHRRLIFPEHRRRKLVSLWITRALLGRHLGLSPREIVRHEDDQGKPWVEGPVSFNLSHSGSFALLAVVEEAGVLLGVDLECTTRKVEELLLAKRYFSAAEAAFLRKNPGHFFRIWTLKEAYVKALGSGLRHPLDEFRVTDDEGGRWGLFDLHMQPVPGWWATPLISPVPDYESALVSSAPIGKIEVRIAEPRLWR